MFLFKLADLYVNELADEFRIVEGIENIVEQIRLNRIVGIAYVNLLKYYKNISMRDDMLKKLEELFKANINKSVKYNKKLCYLCEIMNDADFKYAMLKGAVLNTLIYEPGMRTSNDIDILIQESEVSRCQKLLKQNGFVQGYYTSGQGIVEATRRQIIMSKMNFGETVPFVKMLDDDALVVDLNFSIDYKPEGNNAIVKKMLADTEKIHYKDCVFSSLKPEDFVIHLCCHLYKEATVFDWVRRRKDLLLYKFSDLNIVSHKYFDNIFVSRLIQRIKELEVEKECFYSFYNTREVFPKLGENPVYVKLLDEIQPSNQDFMKEIIDPVRNKVYFYEQEFKEWFELSDRLSQLKEK